MNLKIIMLCIVLFVGSLAGGFIIYHNIVPLESDDIIVWSGNPASNYCFENGGIPKSIKDPNGGEIAICVFEGGIVVDAVDYFNGNSVSKSNCNYFKDHYELIKTQRDWHEPQSAKYLGFDLEMKKVMEKLKKSCY